MLDTNKVLLERSRRQKKQKTIGEYARQIGQSWRIVTKLPLLAIFSVRILFVYFLSIIAVAVDLFSEAKLQITRRMFWGRGGLYKTIFHFSVISITLGLLFTNFANKITLLQPAAAEEEVVFSYGAGDTDILQQGNSLQSVVAVDAGFPDYSVIQYTVKDGDNLDTIAAAFQISKDTIKWANSKIISPFNDNIAVGWKLDIPEMDGVLYTVLDGDTLDKIVERTSGDRATIIEINRLVPPAYAVSSGQRIFIPDGKLKPIPKPEPNYTGPKSSVPYERALAALNAMPAGTFGNPLADGSCAGYHFSRGLSASHKGVDLAKGGGCLIRASAAGVVHSIGYHSLSGYYIMIDHGTGIRTHYFHGVAGTFQVRKGEQVAKGQPLMWMGCTGRCTGTHLHFELFVGDRTIDPKRYVPY